MVNSHEITGVSLVNFLPPRIGRFRLDVGCPGEGGRYLSAQGQIVIVSCNREEDDRRWVHLSTSFQDRLPTYDELCEVKRLFLGDESKAIQIFPPALEHYNLHPYCLHLWSCVDGDPLPDFRDSTGAV